MDEADWTFARLLLFAIGHHDAVVGRLANRGDPGSVDLIVARERFAIHPRPRTLTVLEQTFWRWRFSGR